MSMRNRAVQRYGERNRILRSMGYGTYAEYLESPLWAAIRHEVLRRDRICKRCGCARAIQAHHNLYGEAQLRGKTLFGIVGICRPCHKSIEFDGNEKLAPDEAALKMRRLGISRDELLKRISRALRQVQP